MILGKIKVRVDHIGGNRYFYCRPIANGHDLYHPQIIGVCHVVYLEKCGLTEHLEMDDLFTCYAIFDRHHTEEEFLRGFTKLKISPISQDVYNELIQLYPQKEHVFQY